MLEARRTHAVDAEWERALLKVRRHPSGIFLEACVGVEPAIGCRIVELDVVEVPVEKDIARPLEQRAGLPLVGPADLPAAQDRCEHTALVQERLRGAER